MYPIYWCIFQNEIAAQSAYHQNRIVELNRRVEILRKERDAFEFENSTNFSQVKCLRENSIEKDRRIRDLECNVDNLQVDLKSICGDFLFGCRDLRKVFRQY